MGMRATKRWRELRAEHNELNKPLVGAHLDIHALNHWLSG
jgi:hypothetical protein